MPLDAPTQRPELIPEQLRVNLDAALFFAEAIAGQEDQIAALRQHAVEAEAYVKQLNGQIKELESDRNDLNRTGKTSGLPND